MAMTVFRRFISAKYCGKRNKIRPIEWMFSATMNTPDSVSLFKIAKNRRRLDDKLMQPHSVSITWYVIEQFNPLRSETKTRKIFGKFKISFVEVFKEEFNLKRTFWKLFQQNIWKSKLFGVRLMWVNKIHRYQFWESVKSLNCFPVVFIYYFTFIVRIYIEIWVWRNFVGNCFCSGALFTKE